MTSHLRTTATCASLLVLFGSAALGQPYPKIVNGLNPHQFASSHPASPAYDASLPAGSELDVNRLPAISQPEPPTYVATTDAGRPYTSSATMFPIEDTCCGCNEYECMCGPRWVVSADLLWMSRSRANLQTMIESPLGGPVISESFNARELMFDARAGYRASFGYDLLDGRAVELTTFSVYDQPAAANVADTDMFFTFHNLSPAVATNTYTINYVSNLHNGELNWWLGEAWGIRPMVGARWIRIREEFSIVDTTGTSWDAFSEIENDLVGAQIGFKTRLWNGGNWFLVEAAFKSGIYGNNVDYRASVVDAAGVSQGSIIRSPSETSVAGEITVSAVVHCCPWLAVRFGYHGLWMSEIGLAPNQANQSDIPTGIGTDHLGALNYQGGFIGLEANW
ncbi:MAG TPA: hypothetical protein QF564_22745 [Pirellulaceae bacterium]|nr:hypothetical protein [Pirellulaceae bacterium]